MKPFLSDDAALRDRWPCVPNLRHTFPPNADHCFCHSLRRPVVDVAEVTAFTPANVGINVDRLARALALIGPVDDVVDWNAYAVDISCAYGSTDADE